MAIARLLICEWHGSRRRDRSVEDPSWTDVERAIRALDNRTLNDVYLYPDGAAPETYLCIGGGDNRYVAAGAVDGESVRVLVDSQNQAGPATLLVVGGQAGSYASEEVVDLATVLQAARSFYDAGGFAPDASWVEK